MEPHKITHGSALATDLKDDQSIAIKIKHSVFKSYIQNYINF